MNLTADKVGLARRRRRYLVHLLCAHDEHDNACRYMARIQLWTARIRARVESQERVFIDETELIEIVNPLLPRGSDVRDVLSHVESPDGFLYLLHLDSQEAARLGWRL